MKHKIEVVMLPTAVEPYKMPYSKYIPKGCIIKTLMWGVRTRGTVGELKINKGYSISNYSKEMYQHIYITVSQDVEPIRKGDWCYNPKLLTTKIYQFIEEGLAHDSNRKIIATTDIRIMTNQVEPYNMKQGYHKQIPQLQQAFLEEFVANPDGKWEVEYEEDYDDTPLGRESWNVLKLNKYNTVSIKAVKKKMYSRKEVEVLINKYEEDTLYYGRDGYYKNIDIPEEWIKKNL
jgi:hypothetical protein